MIKENSACHYYRQEEGNSSSPIVIISGAARKLLKRDLMRKILMTISRNKNVDYIIEMQKSSWEQESLVNSSSTEMVWGKSRRNL